MRKLLLAATAATLLPALSAPGNAAGDSVSWKTIIGIIQAGNVADGIPGGGQPWSTLGGSARVNLATGEVEFEVKGLVLAGGDTIGTPGAINQVKGTIACPQTNGQVNAVDTPLVPLSAQGDAEFEGVVGPIPTACTASNVAFLVRIAANRWIANGAVRRP
jgi:hypothetical protein